MFNYQQARLNAQCFFSIFQFHFVFVLTTLSDCRIVDLIAGICCRPSQFRWRTFSLVTVWTFRTFRFFPVTSWIPAITTYSQPSLKQMIGWKPTTVVSSIVFTHFFIFTLIEREINEATLDSIDILLCNRYFCPLERGKQNWKNNNCFSVTVVCKHFQLFLHKNGEPHVSPWKIWKKSVLTNSYNQDWCDDNATAMASIGIGHSS